MCGEDMETVTVEMTEYWRGCHKPVRSIKRVISVKIHYVTEYKLLRHPCAYVIAIEGYPYIVANQSRWKQLGRLAREQIGLPTRNIPACLAEQEGGWHG